MIMEVFSNLNDSMITTPSVLFLPVAVSFESAVVAGQQRGLV